MTLLVIIIALLVLQFWGSVDAFHNHRGGRLLASLATRVPAGALRLLTVVVVPASLVALLQYWLYPQFFGLPLALFQLVMLLMCLGRGNLSAELHNYLQYWQQGDLEEARAVAFRFSDQLPNASVDSAIELHDAMRGAFAYRCLERLFAVLFWFAVGGAAAAVGYRLLFVAASSAAVSGDDRSVASRVLHLVEWLPVRLLAASFALAGNFERCTREVVSALGSSAASAELLDRCGRAALSVDVPKGLVDGEEFVAAARIELEDFRALLTRSLVVWVVVLALIELF